MSVVIGIDVTLANVELPSFFKELYLLNAWVNLVATHPLLSLTLRSMLQIPDFFNKGLH